MSSARRTGPVLVVLLLGSLIAACAQPSGPSATPEPTSVPTEPGTSLTVVVDDGAGTRTTWTLRCDPPGGDHPDPEAACRALAAHAAALRPVPKDRACAEVYGGPETATVRGTWRGQPVLATLSRTNGCEIARWKALAGLLPGGGA